ncbi:unnamed protein product [Phyllotreta striolata]|uniref:Mpv17-like protein 2 n=1 Tax=Phyllotreta striolata TaxID=444603 RepID=A0A9N9TLC2_PHYSR|nr:unnamed protein product [Phyllotreta striolata]
MNTILRIKINVESFLITTVRCAFRNVSTAQHRHSPDKGEMKMFSKRYLAITNVLSNAVLMLVGDLVQQEVEYRHKILERRYDVARAARMFAVALILMGPLSHYYYTWLATTWPQRTPKVVAWKIVFDQVAVSPLNISVFFFGMSALEMKTAYEALEEFKDKFLDIYRADWCIWPPANLINFYIIPNKFQVIYVNLVTFFYSIVLSYIKHRDDKKAP